eukprot:3926132-Amphidinium_carterae.1
MRPVSENFNFGSTKFNFESTKYLLLDVLVQAIVTESPWLLPRQCVCNGALIRAPGPMYCCAQRSRRLSTLMQNMVNNYAATPMDEKGIADGKGVLDYCSIHCCGVKTKRTIAATKQNSRTFPCRHSGFNS